MRKIYLMFILTLVSLSSLWAQVVINQNTTWNSVNDLQQYYAIGLDPADGISIQPGTELRIKIGGINDPVGTPLYMNQGSWIIVEMGAELIVDGGYISGSSGSTGATWGGIVVHGDKNVDQIYTSGIGFNQGYAFVKNGAKIESYMWIEIEEGGIFRAENSEFINPEWGIMFDDYANPNFKQYSYLRNNKFFYNPNFGYSIGVADYWHIQVDDINKVRIYDNTFRNYATSSPSGCNLNAIYSSNSNIYIRPNMVVFPPMGGCSYTVNDQNIFEGFNTAIYIENDGEAFDYEAKILDNIFIDNEIGIFLENTYNTTIYKNVFKWETLDRNCIGIHSTYSDIYEYMNNKFIVDLSTCYGKEYIGIKSDHDYGFYGDCYYSKNEFKVLSTDCQNTYGFNAIGIQLGLYHGHNRNFELTCNDFEYMNTAIDIYGWTKLKDQVYHMVGTGNTFNNCGLDINNQNNPIFTYYYYGSQPNCLNVDIQQAGNPADCSYPERGCEVYGIDEGSNEGGIPGDFEGFERRSNENNTFNSGSFKSTSIYPNPTSSVFNISYQLDEESTASVLVYNVMGQLVYTNDLDTQKDFMQIRKEEIGAAGVYTCIISVNGKKQKTQKLIITE
jgi:parallel beta-helix repeat protein